MKLNHELVRKFLLAIEETDDLNGISVPEQKDFAKKNGMSDDELSYTILMIYEAGFINNKPMFAGDGFYSYFPTQLTFTGHEYLDTIRAPEVWRKSKVIATKIGSVSLDVMGQIAGSVISGMLKDKGISIN